MAESWWRRRSKFFRAWIVGSVLWIASWIVALNARVSPFYDDRATFWTFFPPFIVGAAWFAYHKFVK